VPVSAEGSDSDAEIAAPEKKMASSALAIERVIDLAPCQTLDGPQTWPTIAALEQ
jgi:hypothetical protein